MIKMNDLKKQIYQIRQKIEQKECYIIQKTRLNPEKIKKLLKIFLNFYVQKMGRKSPFFTFPRYPQRRNVIYNIPYR